MLQDGLIIADGSYAVNLQIQNGAALPSSGNNLGELFYLTTGEAGLYVYDGSEWVASGSGGGGGGISASSPNTFSALQTFTAGTVINTITTPAGASNGDGGALTISTGGSAAAGSGGALTITTGSPGAAGTTNGVGALTLKTGDVSGAAFGAMTPGLLTIAGGDSAGNSGTAGSVLIRSGAQTNNGAAGNLTFTASTGVTSSGNLIFNSGGTERFRITSTGAWQLAGAAGTSGHVLTSTGAGTAPTWQAAAGGGAATNISGGATNQIPFQSAASTTAFSTKLTFDNASAIMMIGSPSNNGTITSAFGTGMIVTTAGGAGSVGALTLSAGNSSTATGGAVNINSGNASGVQNSGPISIVAGTTGSGFGGNINITAGASGTAANSGIIVFTTNAFERFRISPLGGFGFSGANYGTAGHVLTSNGNATPSWQAVSASFNGGTVSGATSFTSAAPQITLGASGVNGIVVGADSATTTTASAVTIRGGANTSSAVAAAGGPAILTGGAAASGASANLVTGGGATVGGGSASNSAGPATGGSINITGGNVAATTTGTGGSITITGGNGNGTSGQSGNVTITSGAPSVSGGNNTLAGLITIAGGDQVATANTNAGGNVVIRGGNTVGATGAANGGTVSIIGGNAGTTGTPGSIFFSTAATAGSATLTERFRILSNGAWSVGTGGAAYGTAGQVLTSNGNAAPTWQVASTTVLQNSQSTNYTTVLADAGKHLLHPTADTTARAFTIDSNANVPYPIGTTLTIINQFNAGVLTINITSDTMRLAGSGSTGSRTLAPNGIATAIKLSATEWIINGTGLT